MKRQREEVISFLPEQDDSQDSALSLTRAERKQLRKTQNKKWKLTDRKVDSGKDPCPRHTLYYKAQLPCLRDQTEWKAFQSSLVASLPVTFRIGGRCPAVVEHALRKRMANEFNKFSGHYVEVNGKVLSENIVKAVPWAGQQGDLATVWQVSADSTTLTKNPGFEVFSKLLHREVTLGNVVRQELASMIPALLLGVESHHCVLDMCAAPGSKTEQLLRIMQGSRLDTRCSGMVVANDADPVRIKTLKRRYSRCLAPHLLITCSTAEELSCRIQKPMFDRILADVPCSGDGTIRKFPHIWRLFRPRMSLELHSVQLSIAKASVDLLKPGGRMVYSTCSINPIEDEAVVCALLQTYWHVGLRLVEPQVENESLFPGFRTRPGLSSWRCDPEVFVVGESNGDMIRESLNRLPEILPSMVPPTAEEAELLRLHHCHRILPHDNDTGGFFVAVLELRDCEILQLNDLEYFRNKIKVKEVKSVSTSSSTPVVMKELGYNPKRKQSAIPRDKNTKHKYDQITKKKVNTNEGCEDTVIETPLYRIVGEGELNHLTDSWNVDCCCSKNEANVLRLVCQTIEECQNVGVPPRERISIVSSCVEEALQTWAQRQEGNELTSDVTICAGVPIAEFIKHSPQNCTFNQDGVQSLYPWVQSGFNTVKLNCLDFKTVVQWRCEVLVDGIQIRSENQISQELMKIFGTNKECAMSKDLESTLDNMIINCRDRLGENGHTLLFFLLLDNDSVTSMLQKHTQSTAGFGDETNECGKKRLSKIERKRLKNQGGRNATSCDSEVSRSMPSSSDHSSSMLNTKEAIITLELKRIRNSSSDIFMSFVTPQDVCESFLSSISYSQRI